MKKFSYRLEKVLRFRKYLEKKAQKKLSDTIYEYQTRENLIKDIENKQKELASNCNKEKLRGMDVVRYQNYNLYSKKLFDDQERELVALKETNESVQLHRSLLQKELIRKKQLEKLKEVQRSRYMQFAEKDEQKQSDETLITIGKRVNL
ncbi:MAG: flagellar export protein FliJ [Pseudomonadota bacterium]